MKLAFENIAYFAVVYLLVAFTPQGFLGELKNYTNILFVIGFLGMWRYSWALTNFTRAILYRRIFYPIWKKKHFRKFERSGVRSHCYFMITTYKVDNDTTMMVYRRLFEAAANARDGATIVASVVDGKDERMIRTIYENTRFDMSNVKLVIDRIKSAGKRDAMEKALLILASFRPTENDTMVFVDGDTVVPRDIWAQSAPWFTNPKVGAMTTDEATLIEKENLFKDWFVLRFHQRQVMMCSMGLAKHVLTLTGRMSVFRASLATDPGFIKGVGHDFLNHWRLGRVEFLTGDDKSTWYWLLRHGYQMIYLPDVQSASVETQPRPTFIDSAQTLMVRWFGNMVRTNGRALKLSPRKIGFFTWWSILDQRLSMWTTLVGPISVIIAAIVVSPVAIPIYIAWVLVTRYIFCVIIALFNRKWFPITHPPLLYFSQVFGAAVKTFVLCRLDKQRWTRQGSGSTGPALSLHGRIKAWESTVHHALWLGWLTIAIIFVNNVE